MESASTRLHDFVMPPVQGQMIVIDIAGPVEIDLYDPANCPATATTPAAQIAFWHGRYVTIQAEGGDVWFAFGPTALPAINNATTGGGISNDYCRRIVTGTEIDVLLPTATLGGDQTFRFLKLIGTARVRIIPSSQASAL